MLEDEAGHHGVECAVGERHRIGVGPGVDGPAAPLASHHHLVPRRVDADDVRGSPGGGQAGHLPLAAADVEHRPGPGQLLGGQRQDLLLVFGIGPGGEPLLPPARLLLPQGVVAHAGACELMRDMRRIGR